MDTVTCPNCGYEDAFFSIIDEQGAHYECRNCDHEWIDKSIKIENDPDNENI